MGVGPVSGGFMSVVGTLLRRYRGRRNVEFPQFASYDEALSRCAGAGYEHEALIEAIHWNTVQLRDELARMETPDVDAVGFKNLAALECAVRDGELRVIDFGGACGHHYFWAKAWFGDRVRLRWHVVETETMVKRCADLESNDLQFHRSPEDAAGACPGADMMFTSGTLMYTPDPLAFARRLVACGARFLFATRQGLLEDDRTVITIQERKISKGVKALPPGLEDYVVRYPVTWVPRSRFESVLRERYRIGLRVREERELFVLDGRAHPGMGYLCERIDG